MVKMPPANAGEVVSIPGLRRYLGEGNGNPLQCSCLENPRDGEAWWAAIYGVTQSRTRLKGLSSSSSSSFSSKEQASFNFMAAITICTKCVAAATAAKLLQSCPTLCDPIDGSPPGAPTPGILQARILEWVPISFSNRSIYINKYSKYKWIKCANQKAQTG